jgi:hypothetical protein
LAIFENEIYAMQFSMICAKLPRAGAGLRFMYNTAMILRKARRSIGVVLLLLSLIVLVWGVRNEEFSTQMIELTASDMALFQAKAVGGSSPAGKAPEIALEPRQLEILAPKRVRLGDDGTLRLTIGPRSNLESKATENSIPLAVSGSTQNTGSVNSNLILQTHLDLPGVVHTPTGEVSQAILPGQPSVFIWYLRPLVSGIYQGKVWLHLISMPRSGGQKQRILLAAMPVEIEVVTLLGMSGNQARLLGSLGLAFGVMLGLEGVFTRFLERLEQLNRGK